MRRLLPLCAGLPTPHDPRPKVSPRPAARSGDLRRTAILVTLLNLLLASLALARHATLHMRDGRVWQGDLVFHTADWLVITPPVGTAVSLPLANVTDITFSNTIVRSPAPQTLLVLRSGSAAIVNIRAMDDTATKFAAGARTFSVPTPEVARILFQSVPAERIASLPPRRQGALLPNGDFLDGRLGKCDGRTLQLNSVLFGPRTLNLSNEVAALILRDPASSTNLWEVRSYDGSVFHTETLAPETSHIVVNDPSFGPFRVPVERLLTIRRNRP